MSAQPEKQLTIRTYNLFILAACSIILSSQWPDLSNNLLLTQANQRTANGLIGTDLKYSVNLGTASC